MKIVFAYKINSMPNGTVEYRFNSYIFLGKAFWSRVLGISQGGSHPRVGARCYLLNKLVFTQSNSENLFLHNDEDFKMHYEILYVINKV